MAATRHPFLTFAYSSTGLAPATWLELGEAYSKCHQMAHAPLKPELARELSATYLAKGVQGTTAIEGNTLTEDEVLSIVEKGTAGVPASRAYQEIEVRNVIGLITELDRLLMRGERVPVDRGRLCAINDGVLQGLELEPWVVPGRLREVDVRAGSYAAPHWADVSDLVERLTAWLVEVRGSQSAQRPAEERFVSALLGAILAHLYIAWIHPFGDGNGRTARLVEVQILSESGVVPLVATNLLSDFYNKTRPAYYRALNAARDDVNAFVRYAVEGFLDELQDQVRRVGDHNLEVTWRSYVYDVFEDMPHTDARARQRLVALTLTPGQLVTPEQLTELTPRLARLYARAGDRTPARDMNDLAKLGLVSKLTRRRYRANHELVQRFIPPVSTGAPDAVP